MSVHLTLTKTLKESESHLSCEKKMDSCWWSDLSKVMHVQNLMPYSSGWNNHPPLGLQRENRLRENCPGILGGNHVLQDSEESSCWGSVLHMAP